MTLADVLFGAVMVLGAAGFVAVVAVLCWLTEPLEDPEPHECRCTAYQPRHVRIVRRPFDGRAHPDL